MLIETLKIQSGMSNSEIAKFQRTASRRYKVYNIPKRNGGLRKIEHPSRGLKSLQRWLIKFLINRLQQHPNATAYSVGASIKSNALRHLGTNFTLRLDFQDFFPSFEEKGIIDFFTETDKQFALGLSNEDIIFVAKILCRNGALTIGSPTSPSITNKMMYDFDIKVTKLAEDRGLVYTRYADDIFISSYHKGDLADIAEKVSDIAQNFKYASLVLNKKKTVYMSKRYVRRITGLILTPDNRISVGRKSKRFIKHLVWKSLNGSISAQEAGYMSGYLSFLSDVEPSFVISLRRKYGNSAIELASAATSDST